MLKDYNERGVPTGVYRISIVKVQERKKMRIGYGITRTYCVTLEQIKKVYLHRPFA